MPARHGLRAALAQRPSIAGGLSCASYPADLIDFRPVVARALVAQGLTTEPLPFETLHERVARSQQVPVRGLLGLPSIRSEPELTKIYHRLVAYLARKVFGFDLVFEAAPTLRFHFPMTLPDDYRSSDGTLLTHHSDTLFCDPFDQINCWLPLTSCRATEALQYLPFAKSQELLLEFAAGLGFDERRYGEGRAPFFERLCSDASFRDHAIRDCRPLAIDFGDVALFDARLVHATAENVENATRVSIDFRLLPAPSYEALARRIEQGEQPPSFGWKRPLKGDYYHECSAYEL